MIAWFAAAWASEDGKVGSTGVGCGPCHGSIESDETEASWQVDPRVAPGAEVSGALVVSHPDRSFVGVDLAASAGALLPWAGLQLVGVELTHVAPIPLAGALELGFSWIAPEEPGVYVLTAAANAADGDGLASGDRWALAEPVSIVVDPTCIDEDGDGLDACDGDCDDPAAAVPCDEDAQSPEPTAPDERGCATSPGAAGWATLAALSLRWRRRSGARTCR